MSGILALMLVTGLTSSSEPHVADSPGPPTITIALYDYAGLPADWVGQARNEMARIYLEIGVGIRWWDPASASVGGHTLTSAQRAVAVTLPAHTLLVLIRSRSDWAQKNLAQGVIGFASGTAEERGRVVQLFSDGMEQFPALYRARLLGHLMAHEVGHLLLPIQSHSPQGLMRALWSRTDVDLAQNGRLRFTPEQAALIRTRVSQLAEESRTAEHQVVP